MRKKKYMVAMCVLLTVALLSCVSSFATPLSEVKDNIDQKKTEIEKEEKKVSKVEAEIAEKVEAINGLQDEINEIQIRIDNTNAKIEESKARLKALAEDIQNQTDDLNCRLRSMYMNGHTSFVEVVMSSGSISDIVVNVEMIKKIHKADKDLLEKLQKQHEAEKKEKKKLATYKEELQNDQIELSDKKSQFESEKKELTAKRDSIKNKIKEDTEELHQFEDEQREIEELIRKRAEEKRQKELAAAAAAAAKASQQGGTYIPPSSSGGTSDSSSSSLSWPTSGRITSYYGFRVCPFHGYELHTGVDISASMGTPIRAAASGVVLFAKYYGSYGNAVLIDHGGGMTTLYAHNSAFCVSAGQSVNQGDVIAHAGSTGSSTGPHCHFEVRIGSNAVNPLNYLS